ncbi:histidine phosphatase family protein [Psychromicrobium sp. YIM B11713]|uniref:histidine phosphatase family protein n=1 Tax=Psychromicrobium sp. YIM B11713 TaxID=3145233 RepID=UPI00374E5014
MRSIYLVTHPEATHHVEGLVGGWYDSALTAKGERDAVLIAEELRRRIPLEAEVELYASDLQRTLLTAQIIADRFRLKPILDPGLREKSYGVAGGKPQAWLNERFIPPPVQGERMNHEEGIAGAETMAELAVRVYQALQAILESECETQIVVTHGGAISFVLTAWIGMPLESLGYANFKVAPGSITLLREDDYFHNHQIVSLGETGHLPK